MDLSNIGYSPFANTYWNGKGKYEEFSKMLSELVPPEGECLSYFPKLEKFRRASNLYYQMFNNGCFTNSDGDTVSGMFKVKGKEVLRRDTWNCSMEEQAAAVAKLEAAMDKIVFAAAKEAGFLS